jgi:hypothetical protein
VINPAGQIYLGDMKKGGVLPDVFGKNGGKMTPVFDKLILEHFSLEHRTFFR